MKSAATYYGSRLRAAACLLIISMTAHAPGGPLYRASVRAGALQPAPQRRAINCLDPNDSVAAKPETKLKLGALNGKALSLPQPVLPLLKASQFSGAVAVEVVIDVLDGKVVWARPLTGHPLLSRPSALAACQARFAPTRVDGPLLRVGGLLFYSFPPARRAQTPRRRASVRRRRTP